jgi:hypothetical protein
MLLMTAAAAPPSPSVVTVRLGPGRASAAAVLREPAGVVLVYRISAPPGDPVSAWVVLPGRTAPLENRTSRFAPTSSCRHSAGRVACSVGEEACPLPAGVWRVRIVKARGPAGEAAVRLRIGPDASG